MEKAKTAQVLEQICQKIGGDWLLVGGTAVQFFYNGERSTEDIDLVAISHATKSKEVVQHELFQFTQGALGIGPEFINLAVEFFVRELPGWESDIICFKEGPVGRIFRPSLTLFCALKIRRGSELDVKDIESAMDVDGVEKVDLAKLQAWLSLAQRQRIEEIVARKSKQ